MVQAPTGTVTFLFTDIEGSTRLWEADGAAMREALARHDAIVRDAVERAGGFVFATGGDGFAVAFSRAGDGAGGGGGRATHVAGGTAAAGTDESAHRGGGRARR